MGSGEKERKGEIEMVLSKRFALKESWKTEEVGSGENLSFLPSLFSSPLPIPPLLPSSFPQIGRSGT